MGSYIVISRVISMVAILFTLLRVLITLLRTLDSGGLASDGSCSPSALQPWPAIAVPPVELILPLGFRV